MSSMRERCVNVKAL